MKISILIGNSRRKAMASLSKGCSVATPTSNVLMFSFMKVRGRRVPMGKQGGVLIAVEDDSMTLSSIIIVKCNGRSGTTLADTVAGISSGSVTVSPAKGPVSVLRKGIPNVRVHMGSNRPKTSPRVVMHNKAAATPRDSSPVMVVSNIVHAVGSVGCTSVRAVRMLGSTTSATVCNSGTSHNVIVVAAGRKGTNGKDVSFDCKLSMSRRPGEVPLSNTHRCLATAHATTLRTASPSGCLSNAFTVDATGGQGTLGAATFLSSCVTGCNRKCMRSLLCGRK